MNKWTAWYDSLPEHTKQYLKTQPVWHDRDMWKAGLLGCAIGLVIGLAFRIIYGFLSARDFNSYSSIFFIF